MWDSTGPKGGLGSKFQRCIESEIVGIGARTGAKVGSRIDPLQVAAGIAVYQHPDPAEAWTTDENEAVKDKSGKPVRFDRKGAGGDPGRPSKINHGNVTPSIESRSGGVTIDEAIQLTVLSFPALRKLRFPSLGDGSAVPAEARRRVDGAARTALAALGVAAIAYLHEQDHDLRSRCLLVPTAPPALELLPRDGSSPVKVEIDRQSAVSILAEAATSAAEAGLPWPAGQVVLTPAPKLVDLVQRSRHLSADDLGED
jgi:CRISPR-associated protein Csb1